MLEEAPLIFVVDEDAAVRESLKFALELEQLEVIVCRSGIDLLNHPSLFLARCLVLDDHMPAMDGFAVLAELLARKCRVPVILLTGHATAAICRRAAALGVAHVVEKPLLDRTLLESLGDVLGGTYVESLRT